MHIDLKYIKKGIGKTIDKDVIELLNSSNFRLHYLNELLTHAMKNDSSDDTIEYLIGDNSEMISRYVCHTALEKQCFVILNKKLKYSKEKSLMCISR